MTFEERIRKIAEERPSISLKEAITLASAPLVGGFGLGLQAHVTGIRERDAAFAFESPTVVAHIKGGRKINAIKELRALTGLELKAAKEAVELAAEWLALGKVPELPAEERERIDREAEEVVASLLRRQATVDGE